MKSKFSIVSTLLLCVVGFFQTTIYSQSDGCAGVPALAVGATCVNTAYSVPGTFANSGLVLSTCNLLDRDDGWYSFTATSTFTNINATAVGQDLALAIWSACGGGAQQGCSYAASGATASVGIPTVIGTVYFVQLHRQSGNGTASISGNICVFNSPPPPANNECSGATTLTVNPALVCTAQTAGTVLNATTSPQANGCFGSADDDVWYSFTATNATQYLSLNNAAGSTTDLYHSVYAGTCAAPGAALVCSDPNTSTVTGLTVGNVYYVRVYTWTATSGQTSTFDVCVTSPPPPPANNDCPGSVNLTVNPGLTCTTVTPGTIASATASAQANPTCFGTADDDVWYTFTATSTTHYINLNNVAGSTTDLYHNLYTGACGSLSAPLLCSDPNSSTVTGLTIGTVYRLRIYSWTATANQTSTFDVCIGTPPPPPANDNCGGAINVPVNVGALCTLTTPGTVASATASGQANGCFGTADDDVWFSFVANNATQYINLNNLTGSTTDMYFNVYSGTCGTPGAAILCSDPESGVVSGLTVGNTYLIRVYTWTGTTGQTSSFNLCITPPPPPPPNDNCGAATNVPVTPAAGACGGVASYLTGATASAQANACGGTADDDVWYSFVATTTAALINLTSISGSTTDLYHSVYAGTCGAPGVALVCSDPNNSAVTGLTVGNTYFVRVYTWTGTTGQTVNFTVCVQATGPCGTPNNQDFCVAPAIITQNVGSFSANTSGTFTQDQPANLSTIFCGSIENNSWYEFVADAVTETFNFTSVTGCASGIQAEVYNVTENGSGCCTNFASVSNCFNPGTATTGIVTATPLVIGNTYRLMVDGNGGAICNFTVSGWTATGIIVLNVELKELSGIGFEHENIIYWTTSSEKDNLRFDVQRSFDGINFSKIGEVDGHGTKVSQTKYSFTDENIRKGATYYRLNQINIDGGSNLSDPIVLNRAVKEDLLIYPNPANDKLFVEFDNQSNSKVQIIDIEGNILLETIWNEVGEQSIAISLESLKSGSYIIRLMTDDKLPINKLFNKL